MSRRALTLSAAGVLVVLLSAIAALLPVPYVVLSPGPTANTLGSLDSKELIQIEGHRTYPDRGHLDLTTVAVLGGPSRRMDLVTALRGWLDNRLAVVPREDIYPPDETAKQADQQSAAEMTQSQQSATTAALRNLGYNVTTTTYITQVEKGSGAQGILRTGDVILSVDGQQVTGPARLRALITRHQPGESVRLEVSRHGSRLARTVRTHAAQGGRAIIGVVTGIRAHYPFTVHISLNDVGGPSAGLMFALGITDKLTPGSLTGGRYIAGTGEIDDQGSVSPIGGIPQKMIAAREQGASAFLVPAGNCAEALGSAPGGLRLIRVTSLSSAIHSLDLLRTGKTDLPHC
ncbi:MAG: Lon-like protease [Actinomycetota bacterium]|jgi:PDZ domain-containing protein|nr:Lon-like protease [Actinomycetota bacterium]